MQEIASLFSLQAAQSMEACRLWVFPGQGAQRVGMGAELYRDSVTYRDTFNRGSNALSSEGVDLRRLVFEGPADDLTRTLHAQPALVVSNAAYFDHLLKEEGLTVGPNDLFAGHSVGEWAAYTAAGALTVEEGALAVYYRGRLMEQAFPFEAGQRPMTAIIGRPDAEVEEVCRSVSRAGHEVVAANFNCPGQVVISGHPAAVKEAADLLKERGAKVNNDFPVAGPFHSPVISSVPDQLRTQLIGAGIAFRHPTHRVIANYTATEVAPDAQHLESLLNQLTGAVRWSASMVRAWELGAVEMIPVDVSGGVLQGFAKRIFGGDRQMQVPDLKRVMDRNALRLAPGTTRFTSYPPPRAVADARTLEFSYNAGQVASLVKALLDGGDVKTALLVLDNRFHESREAGMRALQVAEDDSGVQLVMREHGFVTSDGKLDWPVAVVRDLPTSDLPAETSSRISDMLKSLGKEGLAPEDSETFMYFLASRWAADPVKLERMLLLMTQLVNLGGGRRKLLRWDSRNKRLQGLDQWSKVVIYIDTDKDIQFSAPGAMTQAEMNSSGGAA